MNPQPNEHGVYDPADAELIRFESGDCAYAEVPMLEIEPGKWATGYGCSMHECGNHGPISASGAVYDTRGEAVDDAMKKMVERIKIMRDYSQSRRRTEEANGLLRQINEYQNQGRLF